MKKMTVKQMVFEKAKRQFGQAVYYGDDSDELIVNPNTAESEFPWRYSYNLPTEEARIAEQQKMDAFYYELFAMAHVAFVVLGTIRANHRPLYLMT